MAVDILIEYEGDPKVLDSTLTAMPISCALLQGGAAPGYRRIAGHYVVRCFGNSVMFKSMVEQQGYCRVIRDLEGLL